MPSLSLDLTRVALKYRRTRVIATVGPASSSAEVLLALAQQVDVFRLNFSHGSRAGHAEVFHRIRAAAEAVGRPVGVLADLSGPKIRVGRFPEGGIDLVAGASVVVTVADVVGGPGLIVSEYRDFARDVGPGSRVLLDDGKLELRVVSVAGDEVHCEVVQGGRLSDKKGMNLPGTVLSTPALTEKDRGDALFAAELGVDFVALSFVRRAQDVLDLRQVLAEAGYQTPIIAKIEKPEALEEIGAILEATDGIMIARGDLGVEMPAEEVPLIQAELIRLAVEANRPVIVATQMLESMTESARPTRAEVTDVAGAAIAGADAVMLSGETATGRHPVEAVATMDRILRQVEGHQWRVGQFGQVLVHSHSPEDEATPELRMVEALSRAVASLSRDLSVRAIFTPTASGRTARMVAAERPAAPVVALTPDPATARRLMLCWGVLPVAVDDLAQGLLAPEARRIAAELGLAKPGEFLLLVYNPTAEPGSEAPTVTVLQA
jgi:pyruvate kinase